jgi:hypothetical protein
MHQWRDLPEMFPNPAINFLQPAPGYAPNKHHDSTRGTYDRDRSVLAHHLRKLLKTITFQAVAKMTKCHEWTSFTVQTDKLKGVGHLSSGAHERYGGSRT